MDYSARIQSRLPARLVDSAALSPVAGAVMGEFAGQLQTVDSAILALGAAVRNVDMTYTHDRILVRLLGTPTIGVGVLDLETSAAGTLTAAVQVDTGGGGLNPQWELTVSGVTGPMRAGDPISVAGLSDSVTDSDMYPANNAWLDGCARLVGERRGTTDTDVLARRRVLARAAANSSWGRLSDLYGVGIHMFPSVVYIDDGGETSDAVSPWSSPPCHSGQVRVEGVDSMSEQTYQAMAKILRSAAPAGVKVFIGALRTTHAGVFRFGTSSFGDGSVLYSMET